MSNMSYCRFQNTLSDLRDCHERMQDFTDFKDAESQLSEEEFRAFKKLISICEQIASEKEELE